MPKYNAAGFAKAKCHVCGKACLVSVLYKGSQPKCDEHRPPPRRQMASPRYDSRYECGGFYPGYWEDYDERS